MLRKPSLLLALLILSLLSTAHAAALRLATLEYPPYCSQALPGGGSIVELVTRAFATQGHPVQIDFMPWARVRAELHTGRYQGALPLWPREINEERLTASRPLFYSELGFFSRSGQPVSFTTLDNLKGRRVGLVRGYGYPPSLFKHGFIGEEAVDDLTNLRKLAGRRFDLVLLERVVGAYLTARHTELRGRVAWQEPALERIPLLVGFLPPKNGEPDWAAIFEQGLRALHASGDYMRILQKNSAQP
ncbi:transporter substrate-binding domain-containing protein [Pseudomonas sp. UL073]|uniref:Transporter substrate-binding domain-containing protein n=1 Tax=Zestomonas insulae TaxID=2809017 RepID=A0ABS2IBS0_9GAMM|nr:transporter substrate-binding domain-containing protein [Pseudomonas insulae]MBM7060564.1 transporter substrate-binding domain-containing protein [Pseudomonas insulae]